MFYERINPCQCFKRHRIAINLKPWQRDGFASEDEYNTYHHPDVDKPRSKFSTARTHFGGNRAGTVNIRKIQRDLGL